MYSLAYKTRNEESHLLDSAINHENAKVMTKHGEIDLKEENNITIEKGIIGLDQYKNFYLIEYPKRKFNHFKLLQSANNIDSSFILQLVKNSYSDKILHYYDINEIRRLEEIYGINNLNLEIYTIISIQDVYNNIYKLSSNVKAPIIVDRASKTGIQHVFNSEKYSIRRIIEYKY